jgi:hypothetical protein
MASDIVRTPAAELFGPLNSLFHVIHVYSGYIDDLVMNKGK